ncbi:ImmA/IrrE family metallo-endopeptidase [Gracilibacillus xinjiangensis]|uniref:ImmA/IrrE family metallo-endopeptidase n=1 Tax=Gracilibacillus xinjiangensis TaxID=1193282 RepID=A0ABV8WUL1_9BACI
MFIGYKKTDLEIWLEQFYLANNLLTPGDLTIDNISKKLNISIQYMPGAKENVLWNEKNVMIFLNPEKPKIEMRELFFHELCHPLRHHGDQVESVSSFRYLQENQANQFVLYAAMPFYMIEQLELPQDKLRMTRLLSSTFNVTELLAKKRVEQINRRILQTNIDNEFIRQQNNYQKSNDPSNWSKETKTIMTQLYSQIERVQS